MKLEMGESLILSWLRHIKKCQIVQTNWKPSKKWDAMLIEDSKKLFHLTKENFGDDIFKKNSPEQLVQQAEVDALGVTISEKGLLDIYAVDIAFHESGLNYGSSEETVSKIVKKMTRTAMVILETLGHSDAKIIFATPKINNNITAHLLSQFELLNEVNDNNNLGFQYILIANEDFYEDILNPAVEISRDVADTSELFLRSIQLLGLSEKQSKKKGTTPVTKVSENFTEVNSTRKKKDIIYKFIPEEENFKKELLKKKRAYIKIVYKNGEVEYKDWNAEKFKESSNLLKNIKTKTWFRSGYLNKNNQSVSEGIFSIEHF